LQVISFGNFPSPTVPSQPRRRPSLAARGTIVTRWRIPARNHRVFSSATQALGGIVRKPDKLVRVGTGFEHNCPVTGQLKTPTPSSITSRANCLIKLTLTYGGTSKGCSPAPHRPVKGGDPRRPDGAGVNFTSFDTKLGVCVDASGESGLIPASSARLKVCPDAGQTLATSNQLTDSTVFIHLLIPDRDMIYCSDQRQGPLFL